MIWYLIYVNTHGGAMPCCDWQTMGQVAEFYDLFPHWWWSCLESRRSHYFSPWRIAETEQFRAVLSSGSGEWANFDL